MEDEAEGTFFVGVAFDFEENGIIRERQPDSDKFRPRGKFFTRSTAALDGTRGAFMLFAFGWGYYAFL